MPEVYEQFVDIATKLEKHYRDMQDMEFTIEDGKLFMLQTRNGKRTAAAALKIACDLVDEGMITEKKPCCAWSPNSSTAAAPAVRRRRPEGREVVGKGLPLRRAPPAARSSSPPRTPRRWSRPRR
jgi:pyruvate,orthophosphate dikinase